MPSIRFTAPALLLAPVLVVVVAFSLIASWQGGRLADALVDRVMDQAAGRVAASVDGYLRNAVVMTDYMAASIEDGELDRDDLASWRPVMYRQLIANPAVNSVTYGDADGRATWMIRYPDEPGLEYALKDDSNGERIAEFGVDDDGALTDELGSYEYDPRKRPWYRDAVAAGAATWSEPYAWVRRDSGSSTLGIAYVHPIEDAEGRVAGVVDSDISLRDVSRFLAEASAFESSTSILLDRDGKLIGSSGDLDVVGADGERVALADVDSPLVRALDDDLEAFDSVDAPRDAAIDVDGEAYRLHVRPLDDPWGLGWRLAIVVPESEVLQGVASLRRQTWILGGIIALGTLLLGIVAAQSLSRPVTQTVAAVRRIGEGDLDEPVRVGGHREFVQLSDELNRMAASLKDHMRLLQSLGLAMEIQQKLLPAETPTARGLEIAGHCVYCDETGGDYYDFLEVGASDSNELIVAVGDVMGHGIAAALLMATARGILRSKAGEEGSIGELLTHVNRQLVEDTGGERFMTMALLVVDPIRGTVRLATAGHDPPVRFDPETGEFSDLEDPGGMPLGLDEDEVYEEAKFQTRAGQVLIVATDGLWESQNEEGGFYGKERLCDVIRANAAESADDISAAISADLNAFRGDARQDDDITFVLLKFVDPGSAISDSAISDSAISDSHPIGKQSS